MTLGEKIYLLRKKEGLSQDDLADKLGVSRQSVYKWETSASLPEIEKIKVIAKLFDVSFDYLLDDEQKVFEESAKKRVYKYRDVFCTGVMLDEMQADIDNGVPKGEKVDRKIEINKENSKERRAKAEEFLKDIGATEIVFPHASAATAFFHDSNNQVIGFYYAGQVQFVCPIENIVGFEYSGGEVIGANMNSPISEIGAAMIGASSYNYSTTAWAILSYRVGECVQQFEMKFCVNNQYIVAEAMKAKSPNLLNLLWESNMKYLLKNLKIIQMKVMALKELSSEILNGQKRVGELNFEAYQEANKKGLDDYDGFLKKIASDFDNAYNKGLVGKIILWVIILFVFWLVMLSVAGEI